MAVIQKIRDKYAKLAGGIIAVALIGFVINDAFNGKSSSLFGKNTDLAKVDGEKVSPKEYEQHVREYETVYMLSNNGRSIDDNTRAQINEQALRDLVYEKIIDRQLDKLGIVISPNEEKEIIYGASPDPMVMQYPIFTNPETGTFDPSRIKLYEQQMDQIDPTGKERETWTLFKSFVVRQHKLQKYNSLVSSAIYTPNFVIDNKMQTLGEMASIRFVKVPASMIQDTEVPITDADINAYVEKHKKQFSIDEPTRSVDYVSFDLNPSQEDSAKALEALTQIKNELATTANKDIEGFVNRNSEDPYREYFFTKKTFKSVYADSVLNLSVGSMFGPYVEGSSYVLIKLVERKSMPDSVKAQHILISAGQNMDDSAAHRLADSLKLALENGANFDTLAARYSSDKSNNMKGGDLGYFPYGAMVPEFNSAAFYGKTGDLKVLKTQFGYHVVRINDQKNFGDATQLAIITKAIYPSEMTENNVYSKATEFAGKYNSAKGFDEGVKAMNLQKKLADNIKVSSFAIPGLGPSRELIRWANDAKVGDVSGVIKLNGRFVVARLSDVQDKGTIKVNDNSKPMIESMVRAEKKAEKLAEKFKNYKSLEEIAQASGQPIQQSDSFTASNPYTEKLGFAPKVIGYSFYKGLKENTLSPAIKEQDGVTFLVVTSRIKNEINPNMRPVFAQQKMMEESQLRGSFGNMIQDMLMQTSNIKYYNDNIR